MYAKSKFNILNKQNNVTNCSPGDISAIDLLYLDLHI